MTAPIPKEALERCPFCGCRPHKGPTKTERCQLHGEPYQGYSIWCPRGHAKIVAANQEWAISDWNTRPALATLPPDPTTSKKEVVENERREAIARIIYDAFPFSPTLGTPQKPDWIEGGNSFMQGYARKAADRIIASGLVQDEAAIRADEREKCAQKLEAMDDCSPRFIADAIRDRGKA